jgi:uroporphyrinogen decarboxylase
MLAMGVKHIFVHICGYQALNYSMWPQVPLGDPGIVSVAHDVDEAWPSPLESASKLFPNDILYGNVEPAQIHIGTPAEVYELSRQCIEIGKKHEPGFILAPGCEMPPLAPPYNVWMMTKAVNDFGWYD